MDLTQGLLAIVSTLLVWSIRVSYSTRGDVKAVLQLLNGFGKQPGLIADVESLKRFREHLVTGRAVP